MAENATTAFCSLFSTEKNFRSYVTELNETTKFNETLLQYCQNDICNAIWGDGNADISGIGVSNLSRLYGDCKS